MRTLNPTDRTASERSRALLLEQHEHVEDECLALLAEVHGTNRRLLDGHWNSLESALLDHMAAEEELILPRYARDVPDDANAIRAAHAQLRLVIGELGAEVQRHGVQVATVERLTELLREHAESENAVMYAWAETNVVDEVGHTLLQRTWRWLN